MKEIKLPPVPSATSSTVRKSMRGNKSERTRPETQLTEGLIESGISNFNLNQKGVPGSPDITFDVAKLAVFIHGCFWHRCPYCNPHFPDSNQQYWAAKFARNKRRDRRVRSELRVQGWRPMVLWECKLRRNPKYAIRRIRKALEASSV